MGKFKKGVRVRLTEELDGGGPKVGALGTIFGKDEDGDRDVVWDGLEEGHDGLANDGSYNHWYVPKSKLELVEEPTKAPFAVGDRVRLTKDNEGFGNVGDTGTVLAADAGSDDCYVEFDREIQDDRCWYAPWDSLEKVVEEPWVPKVGDRVRMHTTSTWYNEDTMTVGTIVNLHDDGVRFYARFDGDDFDWCLEVEDVYLVDRPVAAEAQPESTGLQIEAGKFYRTRDGRKVGPIQPNIDGLRGFPWEDSEEIFSCWRDDGTFALKLGEEHPFDIIAEWIDEPVVAVDEVAVAEATATPAERKFKVGDRVKIKDPDDNDEGTVATRNSDGLMSIKWDFASYPGAEWWSDEELELVTDFTTQPANDNLVVTITAKNESVADALRTLAAALNAA